MVAMTPMAIRHRLGIKHALLLRGKLSIEGLGCLGTLKHLGATHT